MTVPLGPDGQPLKGKEIGLYWWRRRNEKKARAEKQAYLDSKANEFYIEYLELLQTGKVTAEQAVEKIAADHEYQKTFVTQAIRRQERQANATYSPIGPKRLIGHIDQLDKSIEEMRTEIETQIMTAEEALEGIEGDTVAEMRLRLDLEDRILSLRGRLVALNQKFGEHISKFLPTSDKKVLTSDNRVHSMSIDHINQELARLENGTALETKYEVVEETTEAEKK